MLWDKKVSFKDFETRYAHCEAVPLRPTPGTEEQSRAINRATHKCLLTQEAPCLSWFTGPETTPTVPPTTPAETHCRARAARDSTGRKVSL